MKFQVSWAAGCAALPGLHKGETSVSLILHPNLLPYSFALIFTKRGRDKGERLRRKIMEGRDRVSGKFQASVTFLVPFST